MAPRLATLAAMLLFALVLACAPEPSGPAAKPGTGTTDSAAPDDGPADGGSGRDRLVQHGVQTCPAPGERAALGPMGEAYLGPDWSRQRPDDMPPELSPRAGGGMAVADFNGDDLLDVFLPNFSGCQLFESLPDGSLRDVSTDRLPLDEATGDCNAWGASAVDYDGDGDLDLFLTGESDSDALWENDGTGAFVDVTERAGLGSGVCGSRSGSWADMDQDGDLDLFVARHRVVEFEGETPPDPCSGSLARPPPGNPNSLYENRGDGTFTDVSERLSGPLLTGHSFIGGWVDADGDGDLDLYLINDFGSWSEPTNLWWNDGTGRFTPALPAAGAELSICGMGIATADLNDDTVPDFAIADLGRLHLLLSLGEPAWYDAAVASGLEPATDRGQLAAWGTAFADMDHDLNLDLVITYGPTEEVLASTSVDPTRTAQPDALFLGAADGSFTEVATEWGLDQTLWGRGLVVADLNRDGFLDLVRRDYRRGKARIDLARCDDSAWLLIDFDAPLDGFAARVEVDVGGRTLRQWNHPTSSSLASSGPSELHFGLADHDTVDALRVYWADGGVSAFSDIPTRQRLTVRGP